MSNVRKVIIKHPPYPEQVMEASQAFPWVPADDWPCRWVHPFHPVNKPQVTGYRLAFHLTEQISFRCHVSADERYELYLNGERVGRGSERGDPFNWYYDTYDMVLEPGRHLFIAKTWALGSLAPWAQFSINPGFLFSPEDPVLISLLGTGHANWEYAVLPGYEFLEPRELELGSGPATVIHGERYLWGFEHGNGCDWRTASIGKSGNNGDYLHLNAPVHRLHPATLPAMLNSVIQSYQVAAIVSDPQSGGFEVYYPPGSSVRTEEFLGWEQLQDGKKVILPPNSRVTVLLNLNNYYCGYTRMTVSGGVGSEIRVSWAEALYGKVDGGKGDRRIVEDKVFRGLEDRWLPDGGVDRTFETLWWTAGRYVQLFISTGVQELIIHKLELDETRYPLKIEGKYEVGHSNYQELIPKAVRSLQMCIHETYMDCPYWEQLMYIGDTRLQILLTYILSSDTKSVRKALVMFQASCRNPTLLPASSYPDRNAKLIPSFCMWWVSMIHDYAMWRGDEGFIRSLLPEARLAMDRLLLHRNELGFAYAPKGWNYMDESEQWKYGIPTASSDGIEAVYNWQFAYTLAQMADLERFAGEAELSSRYKRMAEELGGKLQERFWNEEQGLFADDSRHTRYSEQTQCMAVLSGLLPEGKLNRIREGLHTIHYLNRTSIFYSHYLFETYARLDLTPLLLERLKPWWDLEKQGLLTTPESFSPGNRSDCHAWGAHPLYHLGASLAGIRPKDMGFSSVIIEPRLDGLERISATMPHPNGKQITVEGYRSGESLVLDVVLPDYLKGELRIDGRTYELAGGSLRYDSRTGILSGKSETESNSIIYKALIPERRQSGV